MFNKPRDQTTTTSISKQVIPADEILQHGALPGALSAHHGDLRQVQVTALPDGAEGVLQLVDEGDQVLHPPVPHGGG